MDVRRLMAAPAWTCTPDDSLEHAARLMWENDCGSLPVVGSDGRAIAMLTDRDVCMAAYTKGVRLAELDVASAMSATLHACGPEDDVADALATMSARQVRRLPVIDDAGRPLGVLSLVDAAREATRLRRGKKRRKITDAAVCEALAGVGRTPDPS
jgi:CBS domain-containing protein